VAGTVLNLDQFETRQLLELESRGPGTYEVQMMIRGNSLLSSVFIKNISAGATLKVNYFDTSSGTVQDSERYNLQSHPLLTDADAGITSRIIVPRIHNKPIAEVIVTGGTVEFGVYITVVADFPVDLKGSLLNGQTADLGLDGGLPVAVYDPNDNKFYLLQGSGGVISTGSPLNTPKVEHAVIASANVEQSHTFSAGTRQFMIKGRSGGKILLAHTVGTSGTMGLTIPSGSVYESPQFAASAARTIYFQSPVAGLVVEIESWS